MSTHRFLPCARQSIHPTDIQEVALALEQQIITRGPKVDAFESAMADYCGAKHGVAFNSETSAMIAACRAVDLGIYDRFITSPNTHISTVAAGVALQATPVFVDIDAKTGNLDLELLSYNLDPSQYRGKTAIIPVHFAGIPFDMQKLDSLIRNPKILVIEDASHALGSTYKDGKRIGCCAGSAMTVFSFMPNQMITTGEGGMVLTDDEMLYKRLKRIRNNGIERDEERAPWYYEIHEISGNFNLTEFQAALGLSQLKRIDQLILQRQELMRAYRECLRDLPGIELLEEPDEGLAARTLCVLKIDFTYYKRTRAEVMRALMEKEIGSQVHYIPIYRHPYFEKSLGDLSCYFPHMEKYYSEALTLPLYNDLKVEDVEYITDSLKAILQIR